MTIEFEELCPVTQQQVTKLMEQESHIQEHGDNAVTDIKTDSGMKLDVSQLDPNSIIEVNGITGKAEHMIEAGLIDESVYNGSYSDIEVDSVEPEEPQVPAVHVNSDALDTANQIESVLGSADTVESITSLLAGEDLSPEVITELSESLGVSPELVEREVHQATEQLFDDFADYAEDELGIPDIEHFSEWVAYAVNHDVKTKQLYQQAVVGAINGDLTLSHDLVQAYKHHYRMF